MAFSTDGTSHRLAFPSIFLLSITLLWSSTIVSAQNPSFELNPVTNFCSRWYSQSVVKNDVLFIDGGVQKYNGTDVHPPVFGINNYLLTIPLNFTWNWKKNIIIDAVPKNETNPTTGTLPPSLVRGHLFHGPANISDVYVYGGTTYMGNQSFPGYTRPDSSTYSLWSYTPTTSGYPWGQHDISQPWMANHGAAAEAIDQGLGFYLNGQIDWGTSTKTLNNFKNDSLYSPLDGMLVINFYDSSSKNISTPNIRGNVSRVGGTMEYFAPVGGMGILVALGGQLNQDNSWVNVSGGGLLDFSSVDVFDIDSYLQDPSSNGTWYQQNTTGDIPPARIDFCTVSISAPDNSSHHIYMYGGIDPTNNYVPYDDVYVLSIPSFTWTPIFTNGGSPRWGHNCHVVGKRQMITVGGNVTKGQCDWEKKGVAVLDMTTVTWGSVFLTNTSEYQLPQKLLSATGGSVEGAATIKEPSQGWTNGGLKKVFDTPRKWPTSGSSPSSTATPGIGSTVSKGAIAGGVVGGVAVLALIAGVLFLWRRKRAKAKTHELPKDEVERPGELDSEKKQYELQGVNENDPAELPGPEAVELNAPRQLVEADRDTVTNAAELPSTNIVPGGSAGVPFVRTPGDDLPETPFYTPGLSRPNSVHGSAD